MLSTSFYSFINSFNQKLVYKFKHIKLPYDKLGEVFVKKLVFEGFIQYYWLEKDQINLLLRFDNWSNPLIKKIVFVSKNKKYKKFKFRNLNRTKVDLPLFYSNNEILSHQDMIKSRKGGILLLKILI